MLVLTTIFIDVSNNLPKTSYMKMIDVWLLFNLLQPVIVVLTHTYMDTLRSENDEQNLMGKKEEAKKAKKLASMRRFALFYNPIMVVIFVIIYWVVGLNHAEVI